VDKWIETVFGIGFGVQDLSHLGANVLGAADLEEREIMVSDVVLKNPGRFRFTCAHELGHFILHAKLARSFQDTQGMEIQGLNRIERQADRFAAAFLMPLPLVERELVKICKDKNLDMRSTLVELMVASTESERLWRTVFLPEVTKRFGVSLHAAIIRFRDLLLIVSRRRSFLPAAFQQKLRLPTVANIRSAKNQASIVQPSLFDART
jgi:Zn-dependent peptidase ImmA (M78 family)